MVEYTLKWHTAYAQMAGCAGAVADPQNGGGHALGGRYLRGQQQVSRAMHPSAVEQRRQRAQGFPHLCESGTGGKGRKI